MPLFKLIVIYPRDNDQMIPEEYTERRFQTMGGLLAYLGSVSVGNIYRVLIERIEDSGGHHVDRASSGNATPLGSRGEPDASLQRPAGG